MKDIKYTKHWIAETSRVAAVYGMGHILSCKMDKDRDNGSLIKIGEYQGGEFYAAAPFDGTGFEAKVIEVNKNASNVTKVRFELTKDCDAYFVDNPELLTDDSLKRYQQIDNYYNKTGDRVRAYPMFKHDVFTVSVDAFHTGEPEVGQTVTWADATGYSAS